MEFAVNYSPEAAALLEQGRAQIDRFKCADWPELIEPASALLPIYVHFPLVAGTNTLDGTDWERIERLLRETGTPYVNVHLMADGKGPESSLTPDQRQGMIEGMIAEVQRVVDRFGADRVMVENVPYYGEMADLVGFWPLRVSVEPATIQRVIEETGCGLLLDISHAVITSAALGVEPRDYIRALPVHRLRELHITGLGMIEGQLADHVPMMPQDWPLVEWTLDYIHAGDWPEPWVVALEYGGIRLRPPWDSREDVLASDIPRLYDLVHRVRV